MKVYMISSYPTEECGISKYARELIEELGKIQVNVFPRRIFFYREKLSLFLWFRFFFEVLVMKPQVIHIQYTPTICGPVIPLFLILMRILGGSRIIVTAHEEPEAYLRYCPGIVGFFFLFYEKSIYKLSHRVLVHTSHHKQGIQEKYQLEGNKIKLIPHGVSKKSAYGWQVKKVKEKYDLEKKDIITFFGFLRPDKGVEYLILSFSEIIKGRKDLILLIAGPTIKTWSKYPLRLKELVKSLKIDNYVKFTGFVPNDEVPALFVVSKMIVMPYFHSTQSGVLHQAISYATPVIVSDVGGIGNFVKENDIGLIVPPKDSESLTKAILNLLDDKRKLETFKRNELKLREVLSWDNIAKLHMEIYRSV